MKRLIHLFLFLLCVVSASAGSLITATITVTNTPADGDTITINADARTWKTAVATPASQIVIGASIGANATNMFNQFAANPFTTLQLNRSGTNGVTLKGIVDQTITVSIAGTWGFYTLSTNTTAGGATVRVPGTSYGNADKAENIFSTLALDMGTFSTNALAAGTTLVGNLVQTTGAQTVAGAKTFPTLTATGGYLTNIDAANLNVRTWSGTNQGIKFFDVDNEAAFVIAPGTDGIPSLYATDTGSLVASAYAPDDATILNRRVAYNAFGALIGTNAWTETNTFSSDIIASGNLNITGLGSGNLTNIVEYSGGPAMATVSSLANGNNAACPFGGYRFIRLTAGPTAGFTLNGIAGGGVRELEVYNNTGQNMTIAHQSGTDPVATNRIVSLTGADRTTTGDGWARFVYDTTNSRWVLTYLDP